MTRKVKTLFHFKDKTIHQACKFYKGVCSCGESYVGETERNVEVRWGEHNNPTNSNKSIPSRHIKNNIDHVFTWSVIANAPKSKYLRKIIEAYYIKLIRPTLNEQVEPDRLVLFRNGVT